MKNIEINGVKESRNGPALPLREDSYFQVKGCDKFPHFYVFL